MNIFATDTIDISVWTLLILYAEMHYKFRGVYSRFWKKEPEIIADLPHRLEPGHPLPVLLFIKDAHQYPINLLNVAVTYFSRQEKRALADVGFAARRIDQPFWHHLLAVPLPNDVSGKIKVDVAITVQIGGKTAVFHNDNYRLSSHAPFQVLVDPDPLPKAANWYFGDLHYHSAFTSDQVEFGAPVEAAIAMAKAMGQHFIGVTDHSYDLDDEPENYLCNHSDLPKWQQLWQQTETLNALDESFVLLPGEELSVGNSHDRNVHFLVLNNRRFFVGTGDSAEQWLHTEPESSIEQVLEQLQPDALAFAAHPEMNPPLLQRLLIRRDKWRQQDYRHFRLDGLQFWNGEKSKAFAAGMKKWVELLLQGRRLSAVAGNDAHGNFGRFRQIGFPFFTMRENQQEVFAKAKTGVLLQDGLTSEALLLALRRGRSIVTDGPFAEIRMQDDQGVIWNIGDEYSGSGGLLIIDIRSSPAYGSITTATLLLGNVDNSSEKILSFRSSCGYCLQERVPLSDLPTVGYIRLDVVSSNEQQEFRCLTNPIYISQRRA